MFHYSNNNYKKSNYLLLNNTDGKKWIFNKKYLKISMALYQPTSLKGMLVKRILPILNFLKLNIIYKNCEIWINEELISFIKKELNIEDFNISFFCGTPGIHQKVVFQINNKNKIIAYGKYSNNKEVKKLFDNEYKILRKLNSKGINNIPEIVSYKELVENTEIIIQTTKKEYNFKTYKKLIQNHIDFQKNLFLLTKKRIKYEKTIFYKNLCNFLKFIRKTDLYDKNIKMIIEQNILLINDHFREKEVEFGISHRDFTPWNMINNGDNIYVFDWEYASDEYPPYIDLYHFLIQQMKLKKHIKSKKIYEKSKKILSKKLKNCTEGNFEIILRCYLIDILGIYILRQKSTENKEIGIWIELLEIIEEKK